MEQFDVLDCRGLKTGETIGRDEAHRTGAWHGAFHCVIIYEREKKGYALFQKRSRLKKIAAGRYDVSVGGHYGTGESAAAAGPREIKEELGLVVRFDALFPVGRRMLVYCFEPGVKEYEFQDVFLLPQDIRPQELSLQMDEVDGVIEMEIEDGIRLFTKRLATVQCRLFRTGSPPTPVAVSADDFVPCLDNYYLKLLQLSMRYLSGERHGLVV